MSDEKGEHEQDVSLTPGGADLSLLLFFVLSAVLSPRISANAASVTLTTASGGANLSASILRSDPAGVPIVSNDTYVRQHDATGGH